MTLVVSEKLQTIVIYYLPSAIWTTVKHRLSAHSIWLGRGRIKPFNDIKRGLNKEGYDCRQIDGRQLRTQLSVLMKTANEQRLIEAEGDLLSPKPVHRGVS